MRLDKRRVLDLFAMFCDLPDQELPDWRGLCDAAEIKLISQLREDVDIPRQMERLCTAAAACAYFEYAMLSHKSGGGIKVGDISISDSGGDDAAAIRDHFLAQISDLIAVPTGFVFKSAECAI